MVDLFKKWFFKDERARLAALEAELALKIQDQDFAVNKRVAEVLLHMDVFEPIMRKFNGVFAEEFARPEEGLDEQSTIQMEMWGAAQKRDPSFRYVMRWIMNNQGNRTLMKGNPTPDTILYGRAQISTALTLVNEVTRLSKLYDERITRAGGSFDASEPVGT